MINTCRNRINAEYSYNFGGTFSNENELQKCQYRAVGTKEPLCATLHKSTAYLQGIPWQSGMSLILPFAASKEGWHANLLCTTRHAWNLSHDVDNILLFSPFNFFGEQRYLPLSEGVVLPCSRMHCPTYIWKGFGSGPSVSIHICDSTDNCLLL